MSLKATEGGSAERELIEAGVHMARCVQIVDLGTQSTNFGDKHQVLIGWELPGQRLVLPGKDGAPDRDVPRIVQKRYTVSLNEKAALRKDLESWRGRKFSAEELAGFDLGVLIGKTCQIQMVHSASKTTGKVYANVQSIMGMPKGMNAPAQETASMVYDIEAHGREVPEHMPKWLVDEIAKSAEWAGAAAPTPGSPMDDDDVPF